MRVKFLKSISNSEIWSTHLENIRLNPEKDNGEDELLHTYWEVRIKYLYVE